MTAAPHPGLAGLWRAAAAPAALLRGLTETEARLAALAPDLEGLELCRGDALAALLSEPDMAPRLAAAVARTSPAEGWTEDAAEPTGAPMEAVGAAERPARRAAGGGAPMLPAEDRGAEGRGRERRLGPSAAGARRLPFLTAAEEDQGRSLHPATFLRRTDSASAPQVRFADISRGPDRDAVRSWLRRLGGAAGGTALHRPIAIAAVPEGTTPPTAPQLIEAPGRRAPPAAADAGPVWRRLEAALARLPARRPAVRAAEPSRPDLAAARIAQAESAAVAAPRATAAAAVLDASTAAPAPAAGASEPPARGLRGLARLADAYRPAAAAPAEVSPAAPPPLGARPPDPPSPHADELGRRLAEILAREARRHGIDPEEGRP